MLIKGENLTDSQRAEVLRVFVHRWTVENAKQTYGGKCPACEQGAPVKFSRAKWHAFHVALTTDAEWIKAHSFHFITSGARLQANRHHAEPAYLAD